MINETSRKIRDGQAYQQGICFIRARRTSSKGSWILNERVRRVPGTVLSLRSAGQETVWALSGSRTICSIYCKISSQPDCQNKEVGQGAGAIDQQSSQKRNGRIFSQRRRWLKKRKKLKQPTVMIGCASKSSLRRTPFLSPHVRNQSTPIHTIAT